MSDLVLWTLAMEAEQPRYDRIAVNVERLGQRVAGDVDQLLVRTLEPMEIAAAAQEPANQRMTRRGAAGPLRRDPGRREQRAGLDAGHDEARSLEWMPNLLAPVAEGHGRRRGVGNTVAQSGELRVERAQQRGRPIRRNGKDDCPRFNARGVGSNGVESDPA